MFEIESHMELLEEFNNMDKIPMFEISYGDFDESQYGEYEIYEITANKNGLECHGINKLLEVSWDSAFSLDEHLQELYYICLEDMGVA